MQFIDEKFKDRTPEETVAKIRGILEDLGIEVREEWNESGVENCHSLRVCGKKGIPSANGKGVTKEFARASAYGEFIERLQSGLLLAMFQSVTREEGLDFHSYAPDGKYMTVAELIENGEWMDYIIESYNDPKITRQSIAEQCRAYACADDGKILTVPFYSLFEKKYVYLPIAFVTQMYASNGNCAGNTREEAWIHALSEMMERRASQQMLISGAAFPEIPEETLNKYPTVSKILRQIRQSGDYDIAIFDYSFGNGFPIVATRIINKTNHTYLVNVAADPVLEIAIQRTLTELFQGRSVSDLSAKHAGRILNKVSDFSVVLNMLNQVQTGDGLYTADYFANELTCDREVSCFTDNSDKTNKELFEYMLDLYRQLGKPVYVRNYSYLGFPSYKFVVPGFSEIKGARLAELIPEYAMADSIRNAYKDVAAATDVQLVLMLNYMASIKNLHSRYNWFGRTAGVLIPSGSAGLLLPRLTRAYASYRLKNYNDAISHMQSYLYMGGADEEIKNYFTCVNKYLELKMAGVADEKIRVILYKFFKSCYADKLYANLDKGLTPYDEYLISCDYKSCDGCRYKDACGYADVKNMFAAVGAVYKNFVSGQDESEFAI